MLEPRLLLSGPHPLSAVPALSSLPGAFAKLYLDFDGDPDNHATPAYDADGDPATFTDAELAAVREVWARVAEKYAPFNLDVTTVDPGNENRRETLRVLVGGTGAWLGSPAGGTAAVGEFSNLGTANTVWDFSANFGGAAKPVAEVAAHEAGHGFGLRHQSAYSGAALASEYNPGDANAAPVMGNSYGSARGLWAYGPNDLSSTTLQDDLAVLSGANNGFGYRTDDFGGTAAAAGPLAVAGNALSSSGVIERTSDLDVYSFTAAAGSVSFTVSPGAYVQAQTGSSDGATLDLRLELRDASNNLVASADTPALGETLTANLAAGTYYLVVASHGGYGDVGTYNVSGTLTPSAGGPTANAGGPYTVAEGSTVALSGAASTGTGLTYVWDLDNDGVYGETGGSAAHGDETGATRLFSAVGLDGASTYAISLRVTDANGLTSTVSGSIGVTNVAPTLTLTGASSVAEGTSYALSFSASDPGQDTTSGWVINWGDGSSSTLAGSASSSSHTYADNGTYTITATATDEDGSYANTKGITVTNVAPTASIVGAPASGPEGTAIPLTGSATDPGTLDTFSYGWSVTRGGAAFTTGTGASFSFTPTDNATYVVTLTVTDKDGGTGTTSRTVTATNVAPTLTISGTSSVNEGAAYTLSLGAVTDPGSDTVTQYVVDWGDGTSNTYSTGGAKTHTFADGSAARNITVDVVDEDGTHTAVASLAVTVANVAPTLTIAGAATTTEGALYTLSLSKSDPGADTISSWVIDWGDGNTQTVSGNPSAVTHTFALSETPLSITATATDEDGTYAAGNGIQVSVQPAPAEPDTTPPSATLSATKVTAAGGTSYTFTVVYSDNQGVLAADLDDTNVVVTGPGGFSQAGHLVSLDANADGTPRSAVYSITPPGGAWGPLYNGTYSVALNGQSVRDVNGNTAPAATLGTFRVATPVPDLGGSSLDTSAYVGIIDPTYNRTAQDFVSKGDRHDYYRLRVKSPFTLSSKLYGMSDNVDLMLLDGNGRVLATAARAGTLSDSIVRSMTPGTYYFDVYYPGAVDTPYWLRISGATVTSVKPKPIAKFVPTVSSPRPGASPFSISTARELRAFLQSVLAA